jgi:hypothetical protein
MSGYGSYPGGLALGGLMMGGLMAGKAKSKPIHKIKPLKKEDPLHYLGRLEAAKEHAAMVHAHRSASAKAAWAALPASEKAARVAKLEYARMLKRK